MGNEIGKVLLYILMLITNSITILEMRLGSVLDAPNLDTWYSQTPLMSKFAIIIRGLSYNSPLSYKGPMDILWISKSSTPPMD